MTDTTSDTDLSDAERGYVDGLRALADTLEAHPELINTTFSPVFYAIAHGDTPADVRADMARLSSALGGNRDKTITGDFFNIVRRFGPIEFHVSAYRHDVCERVVVATEQVEVEEPDPDAVAALAKVRRVKTVEHVEWVCPPSVLSAPGQVVL